MSPNAQNSAAPDPEAPQRRTPSTWFTLLAVWFVGLIVWALYLALIALLVFQLLT
jgi:hypothetical protein